MYGWSWWVTTLSSSSSSQEAGRAFSRIYYVVICSCDFCSISMWISKWELVDERTQILQVFAFNKLCATVFPFLLSRCSSRFRFHLSFSTHLSSSGLPNYASINNFSCVLLIHLLRGAWGRFPALLVLILHRCHSTTAAINWCAGLNGSLSLGMILSSTWLSRFPFGLYPVLVRTVSSH